MATVQTNSTGLLLAIALLAGGASVLLAQPPPQNARPAPDAPAKAAAQEPGAVTLKLHPAGVPSPALRYELVPPFAEMRDQDAEPIYQAAIRAFATLQEGQLGKLLGQDEFTAEDRKQIADLFDPIMQQLVSASRCSACIWKHKIRDEGIRAKLPYLAHMRVMAQAVAAVIRHRSSQGDFDGAISALQVGLAMARHLENDAVLVQALVAVGIDRLMLDELELLVQQPGAPNLYWALTTLPRPMQDMHSVMQWERGWLAFTFPALRDPMSMTQQQWNDLRQAIADMPSMGQPAAPLAPTPAEVQPAARQALLRTGFTEQQIDAMEPWRANALYAINQYRRIESDIWKCWMLPGEPAAEQHAEAVAEIRAADRSDDAGLLIGLVPSILRGKAVIAATNRRIDGLRIVEAIRADALIPEKLSDLTLPTPTESQWDGPVNYRRQGTEGILDLRLDWDPKAYPLTYHITIDQ